MKRIHVIKEEWISLEPLDQLIRNFLRCLSSRWILCIFFLNCGFSCSGIYASIYVNLFLIKKARLLQADESISNATNFHCQPFCTIWYHCPFFLNGSMFVIKTNLTWCELLTYWSSSNEIAAVIWTRAERRSSKKSHPLCGYFTIGYIRSRKFELISQLPATQPILLILTYRKGWMR